MVGFEIKRDFADNELNREYEKEIVKSLAKADVDYNDPIAKYVRSTNTILNFVLSFIAGAATTCIGFWLGYFMRSK